MKQLIAEFADAAERYCQRHGLVFVGIRNDKGGLFIDAVRHGEISEIACTVRESAPEGSKS